MRKVVVVFVVLSLLVSFAPALYAKTPADKLARGVGNLCSGFLEIPQTMGEEWENSNNAAVGCTVGAVKGLVQGVVRTLSGIWDIISFPAALPEDYEPFYTPDYVFDKE